MRGQAYFWKRDYIHAGDDFQAAAAIDPADQDAQGFIVYTEARKAGKPPPIPPEIDNAVFNAVTGLLFPLAILGHPVVVRSWVQLNPWFQHCMAYRYGFDPFEMVRKDINVDFNSLQPYVQSCTSIAAQERSETMAAVRQQARAKEQAKLDQEAAERRRQDERAAAAERRAREAAQAAKTAELAGRFGKEQATVIASGKVTVGMSKDAVIAAIGQPLRKQEITKDDELWIYDDRRISLSHGKVTYISR